MSRRNRDTAEEEQKGPGRRARRRAKKGNLILTIILIVCAGVFVFSGIKLITIFSAYKKGEKEYSQLAAYVPEATFVLPQRTVTETEPAGQTEPAEGGEKSDVPQTTEAAWVYPEYQLELMDFSELKEINPDIVGWVRIFDTGIDYPIVQTDNDTYYLHNTFEKKRNASGCIFVSQYNVHPFKDVNSVLYGHNMKDGSMFHELINYKKDEFLDKHRYGVLYTPEKTYWLDFFASYIMKADGGFDQVIFPFEEDAQAYKEQILEKDTHKLGYTVDQLGSILTFCTCTYEYDDARFVLHARIMD